MIEPNSVKRNSRSRYSRFSRKLPVCMGATNAQWRYLTVAANINVSVNQKLVPSIEGPFVLLGVFEFGADQSADGFVVNDAVQWLPK
jgi:hypothetical protein